MREYPINLDFEGAAYVNLMQVHYQMDEPDIIRAAFSALSIWMAEYETGGTLVIQNPETKVWHEVEKQTCLPPKFPYLYNTINFMPPDKQKEYTEYLKKLRNFWNCNDVSHLTKLGLKILTMLNFAEHICENRMGFRFEDGRIKFLAT